MLAAQLTEIALARQALIQDMDRAALTEGANIADPHSLDRWTTGEALRHASAGLQRFGVRNARAFLQDALDTERHLSIAVGVVDLVRALEAYVAAVRAAAPCRICTTLAGAPCTVPVGGRYAAGRRAVEWVCPERAEDAEVSRS